MKKTYYHATRKENVFSIKTEGLKAGPDGFVYLSDTVDGAITFMRIRMIEGLYAVIPVYLEEEDIQEGTDHNRDIIKANSFVYEGDIAPENVEHNLDNIPLFELTLNK